MLVELPSPVGDASKDDVPLGVTVVRLPLLPTDTNGFAVVVDSNEVVDRGEGLTDDDSVVEVSGAAETIVSLKYGSAIGKKNYSTYLWLMRMLRRRMSFLVEVQEQHRQMVLSKRPEGEHWFENALGYIHKRGKMRK